MEQRRRELLCLAITLSLAFLFPLGLWFGARIWLHTDYPFHYVEGHSMEPTLFEGDLLVVEGISGRADEIRVGENGDIIVFRQPAPFTGKEILIPHRAVHKEYMGDGWYFKTRGDNNPSPDPWYVSEDRIVGKVVYRLPYIGYVPLVLGPVLKTTWGQIAVIGLIIFLAVWSIYDVLAPPSTR